MRKLLPINIQMFADPTKEDIDSLMDDLVEKKPEAEEKPVVEENLL